MKATQDLAQDIDLALATAADSLTLAQSIQEALIRAKTPEAPWRATIRL